MSVRFRSLEQRQVQSNPTTHSIQFFPIFGPKSNVMSGFIIGRIKGINYAVKGFFLLIRTEHSIISQCIIGLIFTGLGFYFEIDRVDWALQVFAIGLVLSVESLNTAVEKVCDFIHPDYHEKIGFIKDIASGAVAFAVLTAILIALLIYVPHLIG